MWVVAVIAASLPAFGGEPATQPSDPTLDSLLSHAATAPSDAADQIPATQPAVLQDTNIPADPGRAGYLILSDGRKIEGRLSTTPNQPLHVWIAGEKKFQDVPFSLIASIDVHVDWERQEKEWNFAASGSDVVEYSGKTYPLRMTEFTLTLKDGSTVTGATEGPIYVNDADGRHIYIMHQRDKGTVGQTLGDLVYIKSVRFTD